MLYICYLCIAMFLDVSVYDNVRSIIVIKVTTGVLNKILKVYC